MFVGMSFCLPIGWVFDYVQRRKQPQEPKPDTEPLLALDQVSHILRIAV